MKLLLILLLFIIISPLFSQTPITIYHTNWHNDTEIYVQLVNKPFLADVIVCPETPGSTCTKNKIRFVRHKMYADKVIKCVNNSPKSLKVYLAYTNRFSETTRQKNNFKKYFGSAETHLNISTFNF